MTSATELFFFFALIVVLIVVGWYLGVALKYTLYANGTTITRGVGSQYSEPIVMTCPAGKTINIQKITGICTEPCTGSECSSNVPGSVYPVDWDPMQSNGLFNSETTADTFGTPSDNSSITAYFANNCNGKTSCTTTLSGAPVFGPSNDGIDPSHVYLVGTYNCQ